MRKAARLRSPIVSVHGKSLKKILTEFGFLHILIGKSRNGVDRAAWHLSGSWLRDIWAGVRERRSGGVFVGQTRRRALNVLREGLVKQAL